MWEILLKFLIDLSLYAEVFEKYPSLRKILLIQISGIKIRVGGLGLEVKMSAVFVRIMKYALFRSLQTATQIWCTANENLDLMMLAKTVVCFVIGFNKVCKK